MKSALLKFWIAMLAVVGIVSCGSKESMTTDEAAMWIAAYTSERIDMDDIICIEAADSVFYILWIKIRAECRAVHLRPR